jgi:hypothetical protein
MATPTASFLSVLQLGKQPSVSPLAVCNTCSVQIHLWAWGQLRIANLDQPLPDRLILAGQPCSLRKDASGFGRSDREGMKAGDTLGG